MIEPETNSRDKTNSNGHRWFLMLNCLLLTRISDDKNQTVSPSLPDSFSDEVNSYVRNLLLGFSNPAQADHLVPHIFDYDVDLLRRTLAAKEASVKYALCRTDNDLMVLSAAVFDAQDTMCRSTSYFKHGAQGQMGRSGAHYYFAFAYVNAVTSVPDAIASVMEKVAIGIEKYTTILAYITGRPFDLAARLSDGEINYLARTVETAGRHIRLERKKDEFLDAYMEWRERRTDDAKQRLLLIARQLHELDPTFTCDISGA